MLFDLRGRGRRRTIQGIYLALAILMGGGLVLFGIGGNTSGGLLDAFREDQGSGSITFDKRIDSVEKRITANPRNAPAWAQLARLRFQQASAVGFDENTGRYTADGRQELLRAERAWDRYVALDPKKPDDKVANLMVQAFLPTGLGKPEKAVTAMEIVAEVRPPTAALFAQLAGLAYSAGQTRKGDLAADRAVSLAPKEDRESLKQSLESAKSQGVTSGSEGVPVPTG
jgi:hypothetical protein